MPLGRLALIQSAQSGAGVSHCTNGSVMLLILYQMLPAPGVYEALITLLLITVSACTMPLNFDIPALTITIPAETSTWLALMVTLAEAVTVIPAVSSLIE